MNNLRYCVVDEHMVDTEGVHKASIDRNSLRLVTKTRSGEVKDGYSYKDILSLEKALDCFTTFMNKKSEFIEMQLKL